MTTIRDRRVKRTKQAFHHSLIQLMKIKEFEEITVTEIVNKAGYNRGTFYLHYRHKEDLLNELIDMVLKEFADALKKPYQNLKNEVKITELSTVAIFDHFYTHKEFYQIMLQSNSEFFDLVAQVVANHFKNDIEFLVNSADSDLDFELFYTYRVYGTIGVIFQWLKKDFPHTKEYMADQINKIAASQLSMVYVKPN